MARPFDVYEPLERPWTQEDGWSRKGMLAVEVLDAVTLRRISQGITVTAKGVGSRPVLNHGGLFVWRGANLTGFDGIAIDPGVLPFAGVELAPADVSLPLHTVALQPRSNYAFAPGTTAILGALVETVPLPGTAPIAVPGASIRLEWLDDDGTTWHPPAQRFFTDSRGEFAAFVPFLPADLPQLDAGGHVKLRLFANRTPAVLPVVEKFVEFAHPQGRVRNAIHAWDQLS
ncbi:MULTISPECIES: hypothetical protein [unclassified Lysobacter]|uniref:hypothetical protein n=1 Tax=unclassified Lysobacter TaxID=2635362 RepID=UPI001C23BBE9|nr:hypothetical protein [Lysobacter sp. MMG2]MBU8974544.1 hypothetical protein [Lysobacter sp. MMG2]